MHRPQLALLAPFALALLVSACGPGGEPYYTAAAFGDGFEPAETWDGGTAWARVVTMEGEEAWCDSGTINNGVFAMAALAILPPQDAYTIEVFAKPAGHENDFYEEGDAIWSRTLERAQIEVGETGDTKDWAVSIDVVPGENHADAISWEPGRGCTWTIDDFNRAD